MAIDMLQDKIRKLKCPIMLYFSAQREDIPPAVLQTFDDDLSAYAFFCRELLNGLKGVIPSVRFSFSGFALLGDAGISTLSELLIMASSLGFYTVLDAPEMLSVRAAKKTAEVLLRDGRFSCDAVIVSPYLGTDILKEFARVCEETSKDVFSAVRSSNKSASELQDLLTGSRLVHIAAADYANRYGADTVGRFGYSSVGLLSSACSSQSLASLRSKYPKRFLIADGFDYPGANAKNCANAFDKLGHGAIVCIAEEAVAAWKKEPQSGNYVSDAAAVIEKTVKSLMRYITIL